MGSTLRFAVVVCGLFFAAFLGMKSLLTVRPLQPEARVPTFHRVDPDDTAVKLAQSAVSDDDPTRDRLRHDVIDYAKALADDPCNPVLKAHYIEVATAYARAWISVAPCLGSRTCTGFDSAAIDRAAKAFGSPLDLRVRDAMQNVHAKGIFGIGDFPKDTILLISDLAADGSINAAHDTREFRHVQARLDDTPTRHDCGQ